MQQQDIENKYTIEDSTGNGSPLPDGQRVDTMTINMGPQHPSTHGVLRLILTIEGEIVVKAVPDIERISIVVHTIQVIRQGISIAYRLYGA